MNRVPPRANWYLMSAHALTEKKRAPISIVGMYWGDSTVYVVQTQSGKKMFASSAGSFGVAVGQTVTWIQDTGNGLKNPGYNNDVLTIENIITFAKGEIIDKVNDVGINESRAIYVFK